MGTFGVDPPTDDQEAKDLLIAAYENLFNTDEAGVSLFALGFAQALGLMEGNYGRWGGSGAPGAGQTDKSVVSNNWGAITTTPNKDGSCPPNSFKHGDSSNAGKYETCFKTYGTSLDGATDLLRELYVNRPGAFQAAVDGDLRLFAQELYGSSYYLGIAPHDQKDSDGEFTNVNRYIEFLDKGLSQIAPIYPAGGAAVASSNTGLWVGLGALALVGVAVVATR